MPSEASHAPPAPSKAAPLPKPSEETLKLLVPGAGAHRIPQGTQIPNRVLP